MIEGKVTWRPMREAPLNEPVLVAFKTLERVENGTRYLTMRKTSIAKKVRHTDRTIKWLLCVDPYLTGGEAIQPEMLVWPDAWAWVPHISDSQIDQILQDERAHYAREERNTMTTITAHDSNDGGSDAL